MVRSNYVRRGPLFTQRFFSTVDAARPDNRYEIFLYGGYTETSTAPSDVYVLSLPGFVWF